MLVNSRKHGWVIRGGTVGFVCSLFLALPGSAAWASSNCTSDKRGTAFVHGSPKTTCSSIGLRGDTQVGSTSDLNASDANVAGTVKTNEGQVQPGVGQEVDVTLTSPANVVVDAVVVAGGFRYNIYRDVEFLPPTLGPDQHYIPPLNIYQSVPGINFWFSCYHLDPVSALPEVPQALDVPLAGGAVFVGLLFVQRRRRTVSRASQTPLA